MGKWIMKRFTEMTLTLLRKAYAYEFFSNSFQTPRPTVLKKKKMERESADENGCREPAIQNKFLLDTKMSKKKKYVFLLCLLPLIRNLIN